MYMQTYIIEELGYWGAENSLVTWFMDSREPIESNAFNVWLSPINRSLQYVEAPDHGSEQSCPKSVYYLYIALARAISYIKAWTRQNMVRTTKVIWEMLDWTWWRLLYSSFPMHQAWTLVKHTPIDILPEGSMSVCLSVCLSVCPSLCFSCIA